MAVYLTGLYADLRTIIAATWTDTPPGGIWEHEHQSLIPWEELTPPYAVMCIEDAELDDGEYGTANQVYQFPVGIFYVGEITGDSTPIRSKLEALRDALLAGTISNGQVIDVTALTWSEEALEANKIFVAKDYAHRAGRLTVNVIVGTSP